MPQVPLVQVVAATLSAHCFAQLVPHEPQFIGSVPRLASQPSVRLSPLQSAKPVTQVPLHMPRLQAGEMLLVEQVIAQPPQFIGSVLVLVSQPLASLGSMSQLPKPEAQVSTAQTPPRHFDDACGK